MTRLVAGVGINDADYNVDVKIELPRCGGKRKRKQIFLCPFYTTWRSMLTRCYNDRYLKRNTTYKDCTVCDEWLTFSNFKSWMEKQDWKGKQLDKDIVGRGEIYSPETCVFVTQRVNKLILKPNNGKTTGVYWNGYSFVAKGRNIDNKSVHLGSFDSIELAEKSYLKHKISVINDLKELCEIDNFTYESLISRYTQVCN